MKIKLEPTRHCSWHDGSPTYNNIIILHRWNPHLAISLISATYAVRLPKWVFNCHHKTPISTLWLLRDKEDMFINYYYRGADSRPNKYTIVLQRSDDVYDFSRYYTIPGINIFIYISLQYFKYFCHILKLLKIL